MVCEDALLSKLLEHVRNLSREEKVDALREYALSPTEDVAGFFRTSLSELIALLLWVDKVYGGKYGKPRIVLVRDPESEEILFSMLVLPKCGSKEWDMLVKEIKGEMRRVGLGELASKIAIVCWEALEQ